MPCRTFRNFPDNIQPFVTLIVWVSNLGALAKAILLTAMLETLFAQIVVFLPETMLVSNEIYLRFFGNR